MILYECRVKCGTCKVWIEFSSDIPQQAYDIFYGVDDQSTAKCVSCAEADGTLGTN